MVTAKVAIATGSAIAGGTAGLCVGLALGLINGLLVRWLTISPIIVTVATMIIFGGAAYLVTNGDTIGGLPVELVGFGRSFVGPIHTPVVIAVVAFLVVAYVLTRTVLGLRLYAIGGNRRAAQLSGIPTSRLLLGTFGFNGLMVGLAAVLTTSRLGIGSPMGGAGFEFGVLTAVILGGVAFNGGSGRPLGVLYGIAAIGVLNAGLIFIGLPFFVQDTARGALLLIALATDQLLERRRRKTGERAALAGTRSLDTVPAVPRRTTAASANIQDEIQPVLVARSLTKRYGAVEALVDASLDVRAGEIVCLLGDNGAGKSTLIKILSGAIEADSGAVVVDGREVTQNTPRRMRDLGIETVYQDLALCENLSVAHNLSMGREPKMLLGGILPARDDRRATEIAGERLAALGAYLPSKDALVSNLSGGQRQAVAIARAVRPGSRVVILDEPTAALGVHQIEATLNTIRGIANRGTGVILISHDVSTVSNLADRIVVLRLGRVVLDRPMSTVKQDDLLRLMAGIPVEAEPNDTSERK